MRLHMLYKPPSLESGGLSIHQGATSPRNLAAASKAASSEAVVGNPVIAVLSVLLKRQIIWTLLCSLLSAQGIISKVTSFTAIVVTLTIISRAID